MPEELRTEVHDTVQETVIKTIPKKKKCKSAKWLSKEALQIAMKRKAVKRRKGKICPSEHRVSKNSKEKDKKACLSDQSKEIEENNRMVKTRDLFRKIKRYQENFSHKMGNKRQKLTIKDRNSMDLK